MRLWFSTFVYLLLIDLRETGLKGGGTYAKATPGTIRAHLLKIAAAVSVSVQRAPGSSACRELGSNTTAEPHPPGSAQSHQNQRLKGGSAML